MKKTLFLLIAISLLSFGVKSQDSSPPEGLKIGDIAPDFKTRDYLGNEVHLKSLLKQGPVVLMFYRGTWCPYCNRQLQQFQDSLQLIRDNGGAVVAVTPESVESINETVEKTNAKFRIIHDKHMEIMKAYDVAFAVEEDVLQRYRKTGIDLNVVNEENGENLPVPATYIIRPDGKIIYAFFDPDYTKRATVGRILRNL